MIVGTYYPNYLEKETYKRVLSVARSYYDDLKKIKEIEKDCIMSSPNTDGGGKSNSISDPTYNIAQQIDKHTKVLKKRTNAVEKTVKMFDENEQEVIKQNIFCGVPLIYCNTENSERTSKRVRHNFLIYLAIELGETI